MDLRWPRYLMLAAWLVASAAPLRWMVTALAQPTHTVQRMLLVGLAVLGLIDYARKAASPQVHPQAVAIVAIGIACAAIARVSTDVHAIHAGASLFLLYALSATFLDVPTWRRRQVLLLVTLLCLPVQPHIDAHLGLPLRLWTAQAIAPLLQSLGVHNVTVEAIIVTENGVADVANACSGVRTLWYAVALWLCTRLAWPHTSLHRWLLAGVLSAVVAIGFNALRVAALVVALERHASPLLADMAHASLGLLALAVVGLLNAWICRSPATPQPPQTVLAHGMRWQAHSLLALLMVGVALLPAPHHTREDTASLQALTWPAALHAEPIALTDAERALVLGNGARIAEKQRFALDGVQGSLLVVQSSNWRAHHAPELCLLAQGAHIERRTQVHTSNGDFRVVTLQAGRQTAITWFQADQQVLPDLGARLWAQLLHPKQAWSLVTVVVDGPVSGNTIQNLHLAVRAVVGQSH